MCFNEEIDFEAKKKLIFSQNFCQTQEFSQELLDLLLRKERIFEWKDGLLVEAMKTGGVLLIDEISLAEDAVLERLNSVLESERTLLIPEKIENCDVN